MVNKKGSWNISTFLNTAFIYAAIAFVIFLIVGGSGGFSALSSIGKLLGSIPSWGWIIIAGLFFISLLKGGKHKR